MRERILRQAAIRRIVRSKQVHTQRELVEELEAAGFQCTQATISRDLADMGLSKPANGSYALAEDLRLQHMVGEFVREVDYAQNLVIVKCQPGTAAGVASAIDNARMSEAKGSLAGNDTALVVSDNEVSAHALVQTLERLRAQAS